MKPLPTPTKTFTLKKTKILSALAVPDAAYTDASPKGSVDAGIRGLIDEINNTHAGLVTTSSCAGRVSVYLEGRKVNLDLGRAVGAGVGGGGEEEEDGGGRREVGVAGSAVGGKGGGEWLFVSHDPVQDGPDAGGERGYERLLLGGEAAVGETAQQPGLTGSSRLIHFKFEPMVGLQLLREYRLKLTLC
jgi:tRNA wybutosine-synthesizing protein 3